jgi:hypothetical protein
MPKLNITAEAQGAQSKEIKGINRLKKTGITFIAGIKRGVFTFKYLCVFAVRNEYTAEVL